MAELPLLTAVFQNLLSNAVKFSGAAAGGPGQFNAAAPRVVVTAHRNGTQWLFSVTDYGMGIDPKYADRIFVLFQRLNERSTYPGTGVGLALCRKIIEYFGGRIWLDPSAEGTRFCFTLPGEEDDD